MRAMIALTEDANYTGRNHNRRYKIQSGMNVYVYRNLNVTTIDRSYQPTEVVWSVRANQNYPAPAGYDAVKTGSVIHHTKNVSMSNVRFDVKIGRESRHGKYSEIEFTDGGTRFVKSHSIDSGHGWKGVRSSGQKNVHAGVIGDILSWHIQPSIEEVMDEWQMVMYDPYRFEQFQVVDKKLKVLGDAHTADAVMMSSMIVGGVHRPIVFAKNIQ